MKEYINRIICFIKATISYIDAIIKVNYLVCNGWPDITQVRLIESIIERMNSKTTGLNY